MKTKVGLIILGSVGLYCAQSFVIKKEKPKKESRSTLKEHACTGLYDLLESCAELCASLSQGQKAALTALGGFISSEKKNSIDSSTDAELKLLNTQLSDLIKDIGQVETKLYTLAQTLTKK